MPEERRNPEKCPVGIAINARIESIQYQQGDFKECLKELKEIIKEETKKCIESSLSLHKRLDDFSLKGISQGHGQESGVPWKVIIAVALAIGGTEGGKAIILKLLGQ